MYGNYGGGGDDDRFAAPERPPAGEHDRPAQSQRGGMYGPPGASGDFSQTRRQAHSGRYDEPGPFGPPGPAGRADAVAQPGPHEQGMRSPGRSFDAWEGASGPFPQNDESTLPMSAHLPARNPISGRRAVPEFLRPPVVYVTATAALGLVVALTLISVSLVQLTQRPARTTGPQARATATQAHPSPSASAPPLAAFDLPPFPDWRAAYIAADGKVHVSTLDGRYDLVGPALSLNDGDTTGGVGTFKVSGGAGVRQAAAISPDGHTLAYVAQAPLPQGAGVAPPSGPIVIAPLSGGGDRVVRASANDVFWSPDGTRLAFDGSVDSAQGVYIVNAQDPTRNPTLVPGTSGVGALAYAQVLGWIDAKHVLLLTTGSGSALPPLPTPTASPTPHVTPTATATTSPTAQPTTTGTSSGQGSTAGFASRASIGALLSVPRSSGPRPIAMVDVASGQAFEVYRLPPVSYPYLSPDGKEILVTGGGGCAPCTDPQQGGPLLIDTATGKVHALPSSGALLPPTATIVWSADSSAVAVTLPDKSDQPDRWIVDAIVPVHDTGETLRTGGFAVAWSPDGQTVLVGDATGLNAGAAKVWLQSPASPGSQAATLPQVMVEFLGFVRTS
jgi:WD40-like Beta Propeller Repeat